MPDEARFDLSVRPGEEGVRLDAFLSARIPDLSRARLASLIRSGHVLVNGRASKPSGRVAAGQDILVRVPETRPADIAPEKIPLEVLYEDGDIIALNKPSGLVVHPAPGHETGTLVNALLAHCPDLAGIGGVARPGIVHRLDQDTSGVLVAAKTDLALQGLSRQFKARTLKKTYLALVHGNPREDRGDIRLPVGRHPVNRKKMAAFEGIRGREARTLWEVKEHYDGAALLEVALLTGRTHQIRVHMATAGYPVVGDLVYGSGKRKLKFPAKPGSGPSRPGRQMLHAWKLELAHPATNDWLALEAPVPEDMKKLLAALSLQPDRGFLSR